MRSGGAVKEQKASLSLAVSQSIPMLTDWPKILLKRPHGVGEMPFVDCPSTYLLQLLQLHLGHAFASDLGSP